MCGLAGYLVWDVAPPSLEEALSLLRHRGPDAVGIWIAPSGEVGLAHTRLSILDLSEAAHQPLHHLHTHIVYNGEVYNFRQLAQEGGFSLRTRSDTEVLLHAYLRWGDAFLEKLEGMFAFALYDEQKHTLLLARDPFGIKPLWVAVQPGGLYFASELKVLRAWLPGLSIRSRAIAEFLHLGFIPAPGSWYEGVYKVLPGESWWIKPKHIQKRVFYNRERLGTYSFAFHRIEEAEEAIAHQLRRSVASHLVSDVPVGIFLSGGTDSSLVAALAAQEGQPLRAFSLGFEEAKYNELPYAEAVAQHLGLPWEKEVLSAQQAASLLTEMAQWYDEPFGDVSALPTYLVSRLAARFVKVVLAGDGGDELFWGYGRYPWAKRIATWRPILSLSAPLLARFPSPRIQRVGRLLDLPAQAIPEHIFSQEQYTFSWAEIRNLRDDFGAPWHSPYALPKHPVARQALWDFLHYLPDDLLTKVDRASMQHSLEVRVPLLDKAFVELAWRVAPALKYPLPGNPIQYKPLLRRVLRRFLPPALVERRKWGFTIPLAQWLQSSLRDWLLSYTEPSYLHQRYGLHPEPVRHLHKAFAQGKSYLATRLWLLAVLGSFRD